MFREAFERIQAHLREEGRVYLHCSAGLHRTGMVAYASDEAIAFIRKLRSLTADELTEERLEWGERFAA